MNKLISITIVALIAISSIHSLHKAKLRTSQAPTVIADQNQVGIPPSYLNNATLSTLSGKGGENVQKLFQSGYFGRYNLDLGGLNAIYSGLDAVIAKDDILRPNMMFHDSNMYFVKNVRTPDYFMFVNSTIVNWNSTHCGSNYTYVDSRAKFYDDSGMPGKAWLYRSSLYAFGNVAGPGEAILEDSSIVFTDNSRAGGTYRLLNSELRVYNEATLPDRVDLTNSSIYINNAKVQLRDGSYNRDEISKKYKEQPAVIPIASNPTSTVTAVNNTLPATPVLSATVPVIPVLNATATPIVATTVPATPVVATTVPATPVVAATVPATPVVAATVPASASNLGLNNVATVSS